MCNGRRRRFVFAMHKSIPPTCHVRHFRKLDQKFHFTHRLDYASAKISDLANTRTRYTANLKCFYHLQTKLFLPKLDCLTRLHRK